MKRNIWLAGLVGIMALLLAVDTAEAQWRGRAARRGWGGYDGGYYGRSYGYDGGYGGYGYYGRPYGSYYRDSNYYSGDGTISTYNPMQYASEESEGSRSRDALVRVRVPRADARVLIEGQEMKQTGTERLFESPPLEQGKDYNYTIKATWNDGGREVTREKTVNFRAGQQVGVDFTRMTSDNSNDGAPVPKRTQTRRTQDGEEQAAQQAAEEAADSGLLDKKTADSSHEGKVVKAADNKLTMTDKDGNKHTHNVPATATITRDSKNAKLDDLKEGDMVTVTTSKDDKGKSLVVKIEAHSK
jgi:uncharacterized protein (TIGR03000 family)